MTKTWNAPHLLLGDYGIDLYVELYVEKGVVKDEAAQKKVAAHINSLRNPFYGEIPQGDGTFSSKGFHGDVLFYDGEELKVCNKSETDLSRCDTKLGKLPDGWTKTVVILE